MTKCDTCGETILAGDRHTCAPEWHVVSRAMWANESDGDLLDTRVRAQDAEQAAETAVSRWWWEDPGGTVPDGLRVKVRKCEAGFQPVLVEVTGEPVVNWSATFVDVCPPDSQEAEHDGT